MFHKTFFLLLSFLFAAHLAYAEETFTISGEVAFQYDGNIYICLFSSNDLRDFLRPHHKLSESPCTVVQMNEEVKKAGKVPFSFDNVPNGTYTIFTYQDKNNNGEVDFENYEVNEPWGSYAEWQGSSLVWEKMKFDLHEDITGIRIDM